MSIQDLIASQGYLAFHHGIMREQQRNIELAKAMICFDSKENRGCEHSACSTLHQLIEQIEK